MNRQEIVQDAFEVINKMEKILASQMEKIEQGWTSLQSKYRHFHDFDLKFKCEKRKGKHAACETLQVQIKDQLSSVQYRILEKLDSRISKDDRTMLKELQGETDEFQSEIQRYFVQNEELKSELG